METARSQVVTPSIAQVSPAQVSPGKGNPSQDIIGEGSPEGGTKNLEVINEAIQMGIKMEPRVRAILNEDCEKMSQEEVIKKLHL